MSNFFLYQQVKEHILALIKSRQLKRGDRIPPEREMAKKLNIGRMTIRQGIMELVNEGILYREQGKGTFVSFRRISQPLGKLRSFTEEIRELGYTPGVKLIKREIVQSDHEVAQNLKISDKEKVIKAERLRFVDDKIFSLNISYFPCERFPEILEMDLNCPSLYQILEERLGFKIERASETLGATAASNDVAKIMGIKRGAPLFLMKRTTYIMKDIPIEFVRVLFLPDKYNYEIQLSK